MDTIELRSTLCPFCRAIDFDTLTKHARTERGAYATWVQRRFREVEQSAANDCQLCGLLTQTIRKGLETPSSEVVNIADLGADMGDGIYDDEHPIGLLAQIINKELEMTSSEVGKLPNLEVRLRVNISKDGSLAADVADELEICVAHPDNPRVSFYMDSKLPVVVFLSGKINQGIPLASY